MHKKVAILQSNYIPWKGYFDMLASVDEFILYDDVQFTRRDWRNRNQIKTPQGLQWLTVPVQSKGKYEQSISDTEIDGEQWCMTHWKSLELNYRRSKHFEEIAVWLKPIYETQRFTHLSLLNRTLMDAVCAYLGIATVIRWSSDYKIDEGKNERLIGLCRQAGATDYISGPAARDYIDEGLFKQNGLNVSWFDYDGYPEYPQLWGAFTHYVSIVDVLFNCGKRAPDYMRYVKR